MKPAPGMRFLLLFSLVCSLSVSLGVAPLWANDISDQRRDYLAAQQALKARDAGQFASLLRRNRDYILHAYLQYEYLKDRLATTPPETVNQFLRDNPEAAVSDLLRRQWLRQLAARGQWERFFQAYQDVDDDIELRCHRLGRALKTSYELSSALTEIEQLWLTGNRLPATCEPVFSVWHKAGYLTNELVWARIKLAMERRNVSLASALKTYLPTAERVWVDRWTAVHQDPLRALRARSYPLDTAQARAIAVHGVIRLGYKDPGVAMEEWQRLKAQPDVAFSQTDEDQVLRTLGILAAQGQLPVALEWLTAVSPETDDENLRHWRLRTAIRGAEWPTAQRLLSTLTDVEQRDGQWRYWRARIWEKLGHAKSANKLYVELAKERSYYGFLAADRLGQAYVMQHTSVAVTADEQAALLSRPGIRMAQELYALGDSTAARRQWNWTTKRMGNRELQVAAVIAAQWGWHDRAILTVNKTDHLDDLELRFPLLYRHIVETNAQENRIDPGWVYGVMRQESAFIIDARSPVGALGLMQLMPSTGRLAGRRLNLPIRDNNTIIKVENNVRLGAHYLRTVLDVHGGHQVLATAAYNAGPNRVRAWMPDGAIDADIWVENIPYTETRNYVKNVMGFTTVYDYRLGNLGSRLETRMAAVAPGGE
jgi:soluble lytic murein transglycosylase